MNFGDLQYIEESMRAFGASKEEIKQKQEEYLEGKFNLPANRVKKQPIEESGVKAPVLNILSENTGLLSRYEAHPKQNPDIELQRKDNEQIIKKAINEKKIKEKRQSFILKKVQQEVKSSLKTGELPSLKLTPVQKDIYEVESDSGFQVIPKILALPKNYRHQSDELLSYFFV